MKPVMPQNHDTYIKDIAKSKLLFEAAEQEFEEKPEPRRISALTALATALIGIALLLNLLVFGSVITGRVTQQNQPAKIIQIGFAATLPQSTYFIGEPVTVNIEPPQAKVSIAVIAPDHSAAMIDGLTYTPQQRGTYTMNVLLYLYNASDRFTLIFDAVGK